MIHLLKAIIWIVGLVVVTSFLLRFFQYEINWTAIQDDLRSCSKIIDPCQNILVNKAGESDRDQCSTRCVSNLSSWIKPK